MSNPTTLQGASQDRKARLAHLKSLQRKQVPQQQEENLSTQATSRKRKSPSHSPPRDVTNTYISGRNFDLETRGPKLGYENQPQASKETVESQAKALAEESKKQQEEEAKQEDQPIDLFKLQPKKPTWDLKRHLDKKLEVLNVRTDNAIARIVRERIQNAQKEATAKQGTANGQTQEEQDKAAVGVEGATLVEATREMEREDEQVDDDDVDEEDLG